MVPQCMRLASDCVCGTGYNLPPDTQLQQCQPGPKCGVGDFALPRPSAVKRASIVLLLNFNPNNTRPQFWSDPWGQYYANVLSALRVVLSLRRVQTTLPVTLVVSGERRAEVRMLRDPCAYIYNCMPSAPTLYQCPCARFVNAQWEAQFTRLGVRIIEGAAVPTPRWCPTIGKLTSNPRPHGSPARNSTPRACSHCVPSIKDSYSTRT